LCNHGSTPPRSLSRYSDLLFLALINMALCRFFAQGICRSGDSCCYIHDARPSTGRNLAPGALVLPTARLNLNPTGDPFRNDEAKPIQTCRFFLQGKCNKGKDCRYTHVPALLAPHQAQPDSLFVDSPQSSSDSRATVPCRFISRPGGCQNGSCPYLHVADAPDAEKSSSQDLETNEEEASR
jgi:hypothetical protein